jgi:hypothetical protein
MDPKTVHVSHEEYMKQKLQEETDMVNKPPHYQQGEIECIDALQAALGPEGFKAYCRGNAMKYLWRAELKHKSKATEDWEKANWYINKVIETENR